MTKIGNLFYATIAALTLTATATAQDDPPLIEAKHVRGTVYMIRSNTKIGNPTSVLSVGQDGTFMADANLALVSEAIEDKVTELGGGSVRYLVGTHHHGDHTEGFEYFYKTATIITPTEQRELLRTGEIVLGERPIKKEALPSITFDVSLSIHLNGEQIDVFTPPHKSAHTGGDAFVYFRNTNVLYVGDHLFLNRFPIVDLQDGGSIEGMLKNLESVVETFDDSLLILPGHGTFSPEEIAFITKSELQESISLLRESVEFVRGQVKAGKTLDEAQAVGLPAKFASLGMKRRYVSEKRWIKTLYEDFHLNRE